MYQKFASNSHLSNLTLIYNLSVCKLCLQITFDKQAQVFVTDLNKAEAHPLLEAHSRNVTSDSCVLLMAATQSLLVEEALSDGLLKPRALHLIHMHRAHT